MTLDTHELIRRFLMRVLPQGFHRIRYYGADRPNSRQEYWQASVSCSQFHSSRSMPSRLPTQSPKSRKRPSILARAAASQMRKSSSSSGVDRDEAGLGSDQATVSSV